MRLVKDITFPEINILNDDATINNLGGKYAGMDRYEARKAMVADLDAQGLLVKVEDHVHKCWYTTIDVRQQLSL